MTVFVRAASLSNYEEVAHQVGLDPRKMLRQAKLDPAILHKPDERVPAAAVAALLEASAEKSDCPTFGLRMAESRRLSNFGAVSLLITHQATMRDALATVFRYRHLLNEALVMHIDEEGDTVVIREEIVTESNMVIRQSTELAIGTLFRMFRALLGNRWQPISINFSHAAPADLSVHRRLFGPSVQFNGEFNGIVCSAADLDQANPSADPALAQYARQFVDTLPHAAAETATIEARKAIYLLLPLGQASIETVARGLGRNVRTLQRQLDAEGAIFSGLVNDIRRDLAVRYLANRSYSMTRVAEMLGYGQLSSFTRWFVAQFGVAPTDWPKVASHRRKSPSRRLRSAQ